MIRLTQHAIERSRERQGLTPAALQRLADTALTDGMRLDDCHGRLRRWLDSGQIRHRKGNELRIFGEWIFVIQGATLITVLPLPGEFRRTVAKWRKRRRAEAAGLAAGGAKRRGDADQTVPSVFKSLPDGFKAAPAENPTVTADARADLARKGGAGDV